MNIRMVSYNYQDFAKDAYKIVVDIDRNELEKPTVKADMPIWADVKAVMASLADMEYTAGPKAHRRWLSWAQGVNQKYPAVLPQYYQKEAPLNPYAFMKELFERLHPGAEVVCGNGSACVITFQAAIIKAGQRLFTNSGCAAMGYGFPAAIGACIARNNQQIICIDGDGSFQMNLQELQTVVYHQMNIKIIYLNNNGYHSIRQTQENLFSPPLVGVCDGNGISFPDMEKIAFAYGIPYVRIDSLAGIGEKLGRVLEGEGPVVCEAVVDPGQNFEPKVSSKVLPDGRIVSAAIDDMYPFLGREEYESNRYQ